MNFTRAAEVLSYVPFNVTMQIKALEDELGVRLIFRSVPNQVLKQTLFEGTPDIVYILDEPIRSSGLSVEPLLEEHFRLLTAPDHPLAKRTVLQLEDFHDEVFLTNEKGCPYRTMFDRSFEKEGIDSIT